MRVYELVILVFVILSCIFSAVSAVIAVYREKDIIKQKNYWRSWKETRESINSNITFFASKRGKKFKEYQKAKCEGRKEDATQLWNQLRQMKNG